MNIHYVLHADKYAATQAGQAARRRLAGTHNLCFPLKSVRSNMAACSTQRLRSRQHVPPSFPVSLLTKRSAVMSPVLLTDTETGGRRRLLTLGRTTTGPGAQISLIHDVYQSSNQLPHGRSDCFRLWLLDLNVNMLQLHPDRLVDVVPSSSS